MKMRHQSAHQKKEGIDVTENFEWIDGQCKDVPVLLDECSDVIWDIPGLSTLGIHYINSSWPMTNIFAENIACTHYL